MTTGYGAERISRFEFYGRSDIHEGDDYTLDDVGQRSVGLDAEHEPESVDGGDLLHGECQGAHRLLGIVVELRVDQRARQLPHVEGAIQGQRGDVGALEQVLHVALRQGQIVELWIAVRF